MNICKGKVDFSRDLGVDVAVTIENTGYGNEIVIHVPKNADVGGMWIKQITLKHDLEEVLVSEEN